MCAKVKAILFFFYCSPVMVATYHTSKIMGVHVRHVLWIFLYHLDIFHFTFAQGENSDVKHSFSHLG